MNAKKLATLFLLLSVFAAACAKKDISADVAVIVALTQTAAASQNPASPAATQAPVAEPTQAAPTPTQAVAAASGYQPFNTDECNALNNSLSAAIGFPGAVVLPVPFEDFVNKKTGTGCQITFSETGQSVTGLDTLMTPARSVMLGLGWADDMNYGSGGPGALGTAFRKNDTLCLAFFRMEETDPALCPGNEPISACWARLAPEQMKYSATFNCSTYYP